MHLFNILRRTRSRKVLVIGLDCFTPELVFHCWKKDLTNLENLIENSLWGELRSTIPAITVPAWTSMITSKDPGVLGIYGFRNRSDYSYDKLCIAMGDAVKEKRVWNILSDWGFQSIILGVPQTYPIRPLKGYMVSDFLTPNVDCDFTYPPTFKKEVLHKVPDYTFDVKDFRTDNKDQLLQEIYEMTEKHFFLIEHVLDSKPWDFFMFVEIGIDRIHHGFWHYHDPKHIKYEPGNPYENTIHDYYVKVDKYIGTLLSKVDDRTAVLVVSDHGAKRMDGGIRVNQWLWQNGYLVFEGDIKLDNINPLDDLKVDWNRTRAWGSGGYYGRIFLNVKDREYQGIIPLAEYHKVRDELAEALQLIPDHKGRDIGTRIFYPDRVYKKINNIAPDMIVYFGDLYWRSVGSVGHKDWYTFENDIGPDSCNHSENGLFILYDPQEKYGWKYEGAHVMDIAPTILHLMDQRIPGDMQGKVIK